MLQGILLAICLQIMPFIMRQFGTVNYVYNICVASLGDFDQTQHGKGYINNFKEFILLPKDELVCQTYFALIGSIVTWSNVQYQQKFLVLLLTYYWYLLFLA